MNKLGLLLKGGCKPYTKKGKNFGMAKISYSVFCNDCCRSFSLAHFSGGGQTKTFLLQTLVNTFKVVCERVTVMLVSAGTLFNFFSYDLCFRFKGGSGGNLRVFGT